MLHHFLLRGVGHRCPFASGIVFRKWSNRCRGARLWFTPPTAPRAPGRGFAADLVRPASFSMASGRQTGPSTSRPFGTVVAIRSIAAGDTVGYGASWRADRQWSSPRFRSDTLTGFPARPRVDGSAAARVVEVGGKLAPLVGRVTMDMCMAAVEYDVAIGDVATVFGGLVTLDRQASAAGTISYELLTRLGSRVPRRYERPS